MSSNHHGRFFHHFIPKTMPCIMFPPSMTSSLIPLSPISPSGNSATMNDHILNLTASLSKHLPANNPSKITEVKSINVKPEVQDGEPVATRDGTPPTSSASPDPGEDNDAVILQQDNPPKSLEHLSKKVDMNCNNLKVQDTTMVEDFTKNDDSHVSINDCKNSVSSSSNIDCYESEQMTDVDIDATSNSDDDEVPFSSLQSKQNSGSSISNNNIPNKSAVLTFGIDRILSSVCSDDERDQKSPTTASVSPPLVVSSLSAKADSSAETLKLSKDHNSKYYPHHTSIISKLKLCAPEQKRSSATLPYFHHPYGPFHHHHHSHHMNSIITSASPTGSIHNHNSHHHPLSHCPECLFLRRYCGGSNVSGGSSSGATSRTRTNIPSSASSSANNVATNNMQFSSSMANPCGPTSSLSASFTWMANPSIYDNSPIISPVPGYNQHVPLQPSFGISASGFSTLASIQHCNTSGSSGRRKRSWSRAVFTNLQRKGLEKRFQLQKYITKPDRRQLAASLGLTDAQVKVWFQNRRMKWRHSKEGKVSSGTGESGNTVTTSSSSPPVTSTTPSKGDGATKDRKV